MMEEREGRLTVVAPKPKNPCSTSNTPCLILDYQKYKSTTLLFLHRHATDYIYFVIGVEVRWSMVVCVCHRALITVSIHRIFNSLITIL